ncbi:MAG: right-handed parallel beta-helix repeat-containing protein [bacterium]
MAEERFVSPNGTDVTAAGMSAQNAWRTIDYSLKEMAKLPKGDKILWVCGAPPGGYKENLKMTGDRYSAITIRGADLQGNPVTIAAPHTDYDWTAFCEGRPPIDGGGKGSVFTIEDAAGVVLWDLNIVNGKADKGAGVHATKSQVDLKYCCIHDNQATPHTGFGGGFAFDECNPGGLESKIAGCVIFNNKAGKDGGGGRINDNTGKVKITKTLVHDNAAENDGGGLALVECRGDVEITEHCVFGGQGHKNIAKNGGAIDISSNVAPITIGDPAATANADKNKIEENVATETGGGIRILKGRAGVTVGGTDIRTNKANATGAKTADGGGIAIQQFELAQRPNDQAIFDARLQLRQNTLIEENNADRHGGGVFATLGSRIELSDGNTIHKNSASDGAGVYASIASNIDVSGQSEVTDNTAEESGGGFFVSNGWLSLKGVTLDRNKAKLGGGAYVETRLPLAAAEKDFVLGAKMAGSPESYVVIDGDTAGNGSVSRNGATEDGGGLGCWGDKTRQFVMRVVVNKISVAENTARSGAGFNIDTVDLATIIEGAFYKNAATSVGGAMRIADTRTVTVTKNNHSIEENKAQSGAGLAIIGCDVSAGTVTDNIFLNNTLTGAGGAGVDALFDKCHLHPATLKAGDLEANNKDAAGKTPNFTIK